MPDNQVSINRAKEKMCVYCNMSGNNESVVIFSTQTTEMNILAVIILHEHQFCVYKGKRKLTLPLTCENVVSFSLYQFLFCFVNISFLKNLEKNV